MRLLLPVIPGEVFGLQNLEGGHQRMLDVVDANHVVIFGCPDAAEPLFRGGKGDAFVVI